MPRYLRLSSGPGFRTRLRRRARNRVRLRNALAAALCLATTGGLLPPEAPRLPMGDIAMATARPGAAPAFSARYGWMFDPAPSAAAGGWQAAPPESSFSGAPEPEAVTLAALEPAVVPVEAAPTPSSRLALDTASRARIVPLPVPRPPGLKPATVTAALIAAERRAPRRARPAEVPAGTGETPSFFEELFGDRKPSEPALAYAALDGNGIDARRAGRLIPAPGLSPEAGTAVYDISARVVRLPNGEVLEAHSGLGGSQDDPRFVHLRMRGATPPGTYDLTEREALFHGVRAIRLTPVGGSGAIFGRDGLLAHTYMLGPSGASNGCVSFRDYNRFLQAYLRGEVRRLVVVAGRSQDGPFRPGTTRVGLLGR